MNNIFKATIVGKRQLSDDTFSLHLRCPEIAENALPGNFVMVRASLKVDGFDPITPRPYSIFALLYENERPVGISLIIKVLGRGGEAIQLKRQGEIVQITGPLGNHLDLQTDRPFLMVAGGTGIAPVSFASLILQKSGKKTTILYGGRKADAIHLDELKIIGLDAVPVSEDGSIGKKGLVTKPLEEELQENADQVVFACGPWKMMQAASGIAKKYQAECHCSLERYMGCGFGVCLACVYKKTTDDSYHTCCKEGPIVRAEEVDWDV